MSPSVFHAEARPTLHGITKRNSPLADCKHVVSVYSFTPLAGVLFTVPSRYSALSVGDGIEPWRVGPPVSRRVSRVPRYSGSSSSSARSFSYGVLTLSDRSFQYRSVHVRATPEAAAAASLLHPQPRRIHRPADHDRIRGLGSPPFARHYLGDLIRLISFPRGTEMFQFPRFPRPAQPKLHRPCSDMTRSGFPHSGICGSTLADNSPQPFAAYHALHRPSPPRHPPHALIPSQDVLDRQF